MCPCRFEEPQHLGAHPGSVDRGQSRSQTVSSCSPVPPRLQDKGKCTCTPALTLSPAGSLIYGLWGHMGRKMPRSDSRVSLPFPAAASSFWSSRVTLGLVGVRTLLTTRSPNSHADLRLWAKPRPFLSSLPGSSWLSCRPFWTLFISGWI